MTYLSSNQLKQYKDRGNMSPIEEPRKTPTVAIVEENKNY